MAKTMCHHCGATVQDGFNRCYGCGRYNYADGSTKDRKTILSKVKPDPIPRIISGPWDPCFGGGIVRSSVTLLAGEPGAGKSTLLLQLANRIGAQANSYVQSVVYIATEENEEQIKERADRLDLENQGTILLVNAMGGMNLLTLLEETRPYLVILDSLPGFTGKGTSKDEAIQIIQALKRYAEKNHAPAIVTDHITKDLDFAGYMSLMHAVDALLMFKVDRTGRDKYTGAIIDKRVLVTEKNRHGKAPVAVSFDMTESGLMPALDLLAEEAKNL